MKKLFASLLAILLVCGLFAVSVPVQAEQEYKEEIIVGYASDIETLDPQYTSLLIENQIHELNYNRLVRIDPITGEIVPMLAESWERPNDLEYIFHLRKGVKFHDGSELKASDVVFTYERVLGTSTAYRFNGITNVEAIDDYTVRFELSTPSVVILANMTSHSASILSEAMVKAQGDKFLDAGSGPYIVTEWESNDHITLEAFDDYFGGAPKTKKITIRIIPEASSRLIALETGEIDICSSPSEIDLAYIEENDKLKLYQRPTTRIDYFAFNMQKEPFTNKLVRQAIAHAIDRDAIIAAVFEGNATPVKTLVGIGVWAQYEGMEGYDYNPEKAKELLAEAGYPDGFTMSTTITAAYRGQMAEIIQAQLAEVGITLKIDLLEDAAHLDIIRNGNHESTLGSWTNNGDVDNSVRPHFHSSTIGSTNKAHYSNPQMDEWIDEAATMTDLEERKKAYEDIQVFLVEESPWVPISCQTASVGLNGKLEGFLVSQGGTYLMSECYIPLD